jgi:poly(A)-specific ribonuclease
LVGGDLSDIDPEWFCNKSSDKPEDQFDAVKLEVKKVLAALAKKTHIIVGHNLFTDLGFIYKTFKGALPRKVEHFQEDIHELFPMVIDTKYLATQGTDSMNPRANLKELLEPFRKTHVPLIVLHEKHTAYGASFGKDHEAGFDSWMTAELFVKLTAKLYAERKRPSLTTEPGSDHTSEEIDIMSFSDDEDDSGSSEGSGGVPLFTSSNPFDVLKKMDDNLPPLYHASKLNNYKGRGIQENENDPTPVITGQWIPDIKDHFWDIYANKLRVNATEAGVCDLAIGADD